MRRARSIAMERWQSDATIGCEEIQHYRSNILNMVEPLLSGIGLGLITVTLAGLFFAAYSQYKRDNQLLDE